MSKKKKAKRHKAFLAESNKKKEVKAKKIKIKKATNIVQETIRKIKHTRNEKIIKKLFFDLNEKHQVRLISSIDKDDRRKIINALKNELQPELIFCLRKDIKEKVLSHFDKSALINIFNKFDIENFNNMRKLIFKNYDGESVNTSIWVSVKQRVFWLLIAIVTGSINTIIIDHFSSTLSQLIILASMISLISNLSGTAGNQTLSILIRSIAKGEINKRNIFKAVIKQFIIGCLNGMLLSSIIFIFLYFWKGDLQLSIVYAVSILTLQIIAAIIGTSVPLILNKLKLDYAVISNTFITAFLDIISSTILLELATKFLLKK